MSKNEDLNKHYKSCARHVFRDFSMDILMMIIIVIIAIIVIVVLLFLCYKHIKRKIRHKVIDKSADIVKNTAENYLDEKTASKVSETTDFTAKVLKDGKGMIIDAGADIINETAENYLNKKNASKVNKITNFSAKVIKKF